MFKLSPVQLQSILNAAFIEASKRPNLYTKTLPKTKELIKWLQNIKWDNPYEEVIMIDELPF